MTAQPHRSPGPFAKSGAIRHCSLSAAALGLLFGLVLLVILRRTTHFLALPALLVGAIAVFFALLAATGTSVKSQKSAAALARAMLNAMLVASLPRLSV